MAQIFLKRRLLLILLFLLLLLGVGVLSSSFFLPGYIEKKIIPDLGRQLSSTLSGQVYSIGFSTADAGDIVLGDRQSPTLSIGSIHADYSLSSLLTKKLHQVTIQGLTLRLQVADGRIILPGVGFQESATQTPAHAIAPETSEIKLPFDLESLQVNNGLIELDYEGKHFPLPFTLHVRKKEPADTSPEYHVSLHLLPLGEKITLAGIMDISGRTSIFKLSADALDLDRIALLVSSDRHALNLGRAAVRGAAEVGLFPFEIVSASLNIDPEVVYFGKTALLFGRAPDTDSAFSLELKKDTEKLLFQMQGFISEPLAGSLELNGAVILDDGTMKGSGNVGVSLAASAEAAENDQASISLREKTELHGNFAVSRSTSGAWQAEFRSSAQQQPGSRQATLHVHHDTSSLQAAISSIVLQGQGGADTDAVSLALVFSRVRARYAGAEIIVPKADLQAAYKLKNKPAKESIASSTLELTLEGTQFSRDTLSGKADLTLQGVMEQQVGREKKGFQTNGYLNISRAEIALLNGDIRASSISGRIPWHWPLSGREKPGEIQAARLGIKKHDLGSFTSSIGLKDMTYSLDGTYSSRLLAGFVTKFSGRAELTGSGYQGELTLHADSTPFGAIDLGKFDPALKKAFFSGELGLESSMRFEPGGLQGTMQAKLQNGKFEFPEKKYEISGIELSMLVPSLPDLRTAPAQTLDFAEAAIGNLVFSKGKMLWQLESLDSFFLEEGMLQWAGGRVFTNAVRISPANKLFIVPLFCDRLKLTEILRQFGISNAEGEGTVSGRIPLRIGRNTVAFEDGFLYSSPGQGGSVKVAAFDVLAAGIPRNTPQFAQVDFAAEALKNFQYNWVKLLLNSEGEDMILQMQMDGRPVQSLPFKYDSQTGLLQRVEDGTQSIDQPIRLDVNFRLPLNRFLGYSGKIQDIMKKIK